jgi:hypothetical protein
MWLTLLLLLVTLVVLYLLTLVPVSTASIRPLTVTRQLAAGAKKYRIWTAGTANGVPGRYYMAAYGVTQETALRIIQQANAQSAKPYTPQQIQIAAATITIGTIVFYFRASGDAQPFSASKHLAPIGTLPDITADDVFALTQYPTETLIQVPALDNDQVTACQNPELCRDGVLSFGGVVTGSALSLQATGQAVTITRAWTPTGVQALVTGPFLCPYREEPGAEPSSTLAQACSTVGVGGPRIPAMVAGVGDTYYLEVV